MGMEARNTRGTVALGCDEMEGRGAVPNFAVGLLAMAHGVEKKTGSPDWRRETTASGPASAPPAVS